MSRLSAGDLVKAWSQSARLCCLVAEVLLGNSVGSSSLLTTLTTLFLRAALVSVCCPEEGGGLGGRVGIAERGCPVQQQHADRGETQSRQREPTAALQTARLPLPQACWHLRTLQTLGLSTAACTWQRSVCCVSLEFRRLL
jgi:hypothetical protein